MTHQIKRLSHCGAVALLLRVMFVMSALVIGFAPQASADVTYTYTGNPFTVFGGSYQCPPICRVTGSFTVSTALPANTYVSLFPALTPFPGGVVSPISFSFTDGLNTFSTNSIPPFNVGNWVATDAQGHITAWMLAFHNTVAGWDPLQCHESPRIMSRTNHLWGICHLIVTSTAFLALGASVTLRELGRWVRRFVRL
jgi:hypothetical protein